MTTTDNADCRCIMTGEVQVLHFTLKLVSRRAFLNTYKKLMGPVPGDFPTVLDMHNSFFVIAVVMLSGILATYFLHF